MHFFHNYTERRGYGKNVDKGIRLCYSTMLVIFEGLILCFWLLLICVIGIANGLAGLVVFYEQDFVSTSMGDL